MMAIIKIITWVMDHAKRVTHVVTGHRARRLVLDVLIPEVTIVRNSVIIGRVLLSSKPRADLLKAMGHGDLNIKMEVRKRGRGHRGQLIQ